ncbi:hypothetical protein G5B47_02635 [Paenibacillus sp. 7124]|uniref:RDRP core domain-containing protein n=1 Tax=Paenibacillus apii TaxID=1850370 RepID=A0A6M1PGD1_9BACL|nr:hypothetical protein [Paenibacillus apii]NGM81305.1 hypothetical protein [Paenibacillus apii]
MTSNKSKKANLSKQVYIPNITTSFFFNGEEQAIQDKLFKMYRIQKRRDEIIDKLPKKNKSKKRMYKARKKQMTEYIDLTKQELNSLVKQNVSHRSLTSTIKPSHMAGMFESTLSRTLGMVSQYSKLASKKPCYHMMIVESFNLDLFGQLVKDGFTYKGEEYTYFSSSAGQIKKKKGVFVKISLWKKYEMTITCGLTRDMINTKGGINPSKLLAYMMLANSATMPWKVDLDRVIVIDDLDTTLPDVVVDYVNDEDWSVTRTTRDITIKHTDGVGFCLPSVSSKAMMIRSPWMKGLLVPVPFDKYKGKTTKVVDVWGKTWDIIDDNIQVILHKSQFKLSDYYDSWQDYKEKFKRHKCEMAIGSVEDETFAQASLTYQMLQTLTDVSDEELKTLVTATNDKIDQIGRDKDVMLEIMGVTEANSNKNYLQQALEVYPNLLRDNYVREEIKTAKESYVKQAKAGKISIPNSKYTYVCPDVVAWLQWLFDQEANPSGALMNGEVRCNLYDQGKILLERSPHLYREHAVRNNVIDQAYNDYFISNCVYTSCHDPISTLLMLDWDGDKLLCSDDPLLISIAERNMNNIVPLAYNLQSAPKQIITQEAIFEALKNGFRSNIGDISNAISRAWHMEVTDEVMDDIKRLCALNNMEIDFSKTQYRAPINDEELKKRLDEYKRGKLPQVFKYAKDKKKGLQPEGKRTLDRLADMVSSKRISFADVVDDFNYKMLMTELKREPKMREIEEIRFTYDKLNKNKKVIKNKYQRENTKSSTKQVTDYMFTYIRDELLKAYNNPKVLTNVLVEYLYTVKKTAYKDTLWNCFGEEIISNIEENLSRVKPCEQCGKDIIRKQGLKFCPECAASREKARKKNCKKAM